MVVSLADEDAARSPALLPTPFERGLVAAPRFVMPMRSSSVLRFEGLLLWSRSPASLELC